MKTDTYKEISGFGKTGQNLREFGESQNAMNAQLSEKLELLTNQLGQALERIAELELEQHGNMQRFAAYEAEIADLRKEVDRLRLTAKLNSNTIDRLAKQNTAE
ncbi:MAG: hypothetical protein IJY06_02415 [Oscillospiraceae bacterium]|jgi:predicted nuclease with TOPRIM domain|nr:hypothetical protein [Oscillospiraceae bacterium]